MNIIVCVKQVPDPEVPPSKFKIDPATKTIIPSGLPPVISTFDAQACEAACRIKDKDKNTKITVISMGSVKAVDAVKHGLAMGADEGVVLQDDSFEGSDSFGTAHILAQTIKKLGTYDLILCGRQAADWEAGQVGTLIAEILGIPLVTIASDVAFTDGSLQVTRALKDGYAIIEAAMPCVITVSSEIGAPRIPRGMNIIKAASKQVPVWHAADINVDPQKMGKAGSHTEIVNLVIPARDIACEMMKGETAAEMIDNLIQKLQKEGVL